MTHSRVMRIPRDRRTTERSTRRRGILRALALAAVVVLAGCSVASELARLPEDLGASVRAPASPLVSPGVEAAHEVRQVIERANAAQQEAFASDDPEVMRDTSTQEHYEEMAATNRALARSGVTSIQLIDLEWGETSVAGPTAQATTYETWRTGYADGSTAEQRDRNDYTLVLQAGRWKIASNVQPEAGSTAPARGRTDPGADQVPNPAGATSRSSNWSGYTATGGTFTSVTGTWTVPDVSSATPGVDASWVGIGGVRSEDLIQAGTMASVSGSGAVSYEAWIEMLPAPSRPVPLSVSAGDSVTVTVSERSADRWLLELRNNTTGGTYSINVDYDSSKSSAEWIQEAPSSNSGLLPLSDFGSVRFSGASAVRDGAAMSLRALGARAVTMYNAAGQPLAVPSELIGDDSFVVTRTEAPSTTGPRRRR